MYKFFILIPVMLFFQVVPVTVSAQNLVSNSSFEDTLSCPNMHSQMYKAVGWSKTRDTPDYFNECSSTNVSVPYNLRGYQYPYSGKAYGGFASFWLPLFYRECLGTTLLQSLIVGQKYFASMRVSLAVNPSGELNIASNKIGFQFSTIDYSLTYSAPINNISQVYTDSIVTDSLGWTFITGSFIADSSYQYVSIGNFFDDNNTNYTIFGSNAAGAYYYVDDVCISADSLLCNSKFTDIDINDVTNQIPVYPNPVFDKLYINIPPNNKVKLTLFDITSRKLFMEEFIGSKYLNAEMLAKGVYFYIITDEEKIISTGKFIKN